MGRKTGEQGRASLKHMRRLGVLQRWISKAGDVPRAPSNPELACRKMVRVEAQWPGPHVVDPRLGCWNTQNPFGGQINHPLYFCGSADCWVLCTLPPAWHSDRGQSLALSAGHKACLSLQWAGTRTLQSVSVSSQFSISGLGVGRVKLSLLGVQQLRSSPVAAW